MQNCEEKIPTLDFTGLEDEEVDCLIYAISEVCEKLVKESCIVIKITKNET